MVITKNLLKINFELKLIYLFICRVSHSWPAKVLVIPIVAFAVLYNIPKFFELRTKVPGEEYDNIVETLGDINSTVLNGKVIMIAVLIWHDICHSPNSPTRSTMSYDSTKDSSVIFGFLHHLHKSWHFQKSFIVPILMVELTRVIYYGSVKEADEFSLCHMSQSVTNEI